MFQPRGVGTCFVTKGEKFMRARFKKRLKQFICRIKGHKSSSVATLVDLHKMHCLRCGHSLVPEYLIPLSVYGTLMEFAEKNPQAKVAIA